MQVDFWNLRFSENGFAYGVEPNDFLASQTFLPGSKVLCLAEGEGRNAVYLAGLGCAVTAIDIAYEGIEKMKDLAVMKQVSLTTICADLASYELEEGNWDAIVIIFGHFPPNLRRLVHGSLYKALKPGGRLIIEAYSKEQLSFQTGGPTNLELLYSVEELKADFVSFTTIEINQLEREIHEGKYHNGHSSVVQVFARK
jgi:SAM-dependent methyltransferase